MILTLGALAVVHRAGCGGDPRGAIPFALVLAAGVSALGRRVRRLGAGGGGGARRGGDRATCRRAAAARASCSTLVAVGGGRRSLCARLATWAGLSGSLHVAQSIASTSNPGNLQAPLRAAQVFGMWLRGSYKLPPGGAAARSPTR